MTTLELIIIAVLLMVVFVGKLTIIPAVLIAIVAIVVLRLIGRNNTVV